MLSTDSSSSIQKRRQLHRRQQSLEVPILATPLPAIHRRNPPARSGHRRGLSLDHSLSALQSSAGFRPVHSTQDFVTPSVSPSVRIKLEDQTTNPGHPPANQQHFTQVTQQHHPAQPGFATQDFSSHLQQQLNPHLTPSLIPSPQSADPHRLRALQELQHHMVWYSQTYGASPNAQNMQESPYPDFQPTPAGDPHGISMGLPMDQPLPIANPTLVPTVHARTVPNTPQAFTTHNWPSPPPSDVKHARSQSFQLDVAPMPGSSFGIATISQPIDSFIQDDTAWNTDNGYASSVYSASAIDPTSPGNQHNVASLPTLFEEAPAPLGAQTTVDGGFNESSLLLQATAGASQNFDDAGFDFDTSIAPSPRQQLLDSLGPNIPASIIETGVAPYEVQRHIGEIGLDNKYPCLWEKCDRRFGRKENIRAHVQTHLGDRQFRCDLCDKTFVRQHDLKRHIAIHSEDRPHLCPCGTGFARHDALTRHRQRGMCPGVLPGYEKTEEEKPKRGRPKKERSDLESRTDKASRQRRKNKDAADAEAGAAYASSSSSTSVRSYPVTPPDTSDAFDADAFLDLTNEAMQFDGGVTSSWRDTPPTSPLSASPAKPGDFVSPAMLSNHSNHSSPPSGQISDYASPAPTNNAASSFYGGSSPVEFDLFNDGLVDVHPDVGFDVFSPPGESSNSSVYMNALDEFEMQVTHSHSKADHFPTGPQPVHRDTRSLAEVLDEWMASH